MSIDLIGQTISGAWFHSPEHKYRYALWRIWDKTKKIMLFVGLNPSKAGAVKNDPTVIRVINYAKKWGYGGLFVGNCRPLVTTNPKLLLITPNNDLHNALNRIALRRMRELSDFTLVGWGSLVKFTNKTNEILNILGEPIFCLKVNKDGNPVHPLYQPSHLQPIEYIKPKGSK